MISSIFKSTKTITCLLIFICSVSININLFAQKKKHGSQKTNEQHINVKDINVKDINVKDINSSGQKTKLVKLTNAQKDS